MELQNVMDKKSVLILASTVGSAAIIGAAAVMIWNSRQMKTMRLMHQASRILYLLGSAMQSFSGFENQ